VTVSSGAVSTGGAGSIGIDASGTGLVTVTSGSVVTSGANSAGISVHQSGYGTGDGDPTCEPDCPDYTPSAIIAPGGPHEEVGVGPGVVIDSSSMTTSGDSSPGISGFSADGFVQITSGTVETSGASSPGITALAHTDILIDSGDVDTTGNSSGGISAYSDTADVTINSDTVVTRGDNSAGIYAAADLAGAYLPVVTVNSTSVTTGTDSSGANSRGIDRAAPARSWSIRAASRPMAPIRSESTPIRASRIPIASATTSPGPFQCSIRRISGSRSTAAA